MLKHIRRGAEVVRKKFKQIFLDALRYMYICTYVHMRMYVCMYMLFREKKKVHHKIFLSIFLLLDILNVL